MWTGPPQLSWGSRSQRAGDAGSGQPWGFTCPRGPGTPGALPSRPWLCPPCPCGASEPEALGSHADRGAAPPPPPHSGAPTVSGEQSRAPLLSIGVRRRAASKASRRASGHRGSSLGCPSAGRRGTRGSSRPRSPNMSLPQRIRRRRPGVPPKCTCERPAGRESNRHKSLGTPAVQAAIGVATRRGQPSSPRGPRLPPSTLGPHVGVRVRLTSQPGPHVSPCSLCEVFHKEPAEAVWTPDSVLVADAARAAGGSPSPRPLRLGHALGQPRPTVSRAAAPCMAGTASQAPRARGSPGPRQRLTGRPAHAWRRGPRGAHLWGAGSSGSELRTPDAAVGAVSLPPKGLTLSSTDLAPRDRPGKLRGHRPSCPGADVAPSSKASRGDGPRGVPAPLPPAHLGSHRQGRSRPARDASLTSALVLKVTGSPGFGASCWVLALGRILSPRPSGPSCFPCRLVPQGPARVPGLRRRLTPRTPAPSTLVDASLAFCVAGAWEPGGRSPEGTPRARLSCRS